MFQGSKFKNDIFVKENGVHEAWQASSCMLTAGMSMAGSLILGYQLVSNQYSW